MVGKAALSECCNSYAQAVRKSIQDSSSRVQDLSAEMTVIWWERWLEAEDQMPNEPVIQHRALVWKLVYEKEYLHDMHWWGVSNALSRPSWWRLRDKALDNLSIQYFGTEDDDPSKPAVRLKITARPKHSNFGSCKECTDAKERWLSYRR